MIMYTSNRQLIIFAIIVFLAACGGGGGGGNSGNTNVPATASAEPATASTINGQQVLTITFNRTMDPAHFSLGGTLGDQSDGGAWTNTDVENDTLTVSPAGQWPEGADQQLTIDGRDTQGLAIDTITLTYNIDATNPQANVAPATSSTIGAGQQIVVTFDESMDAASLSLSGTMGAESDSGVWSSTTYENDTLTLTAQSTWSDGTARALNLSATDIAGNPVTMNLTYNVDGTAPAATPATSNGSIITATQALVIQFDESMNPATLSLAGSLVPDSDNGNWSHTVFPNDTLTVSPASTWSPGIADLIIEAQDAYGNNLPTLTLSYDANVVFVSASGGNPGNPGRHDQPRATITGGIETAAALGIENVWVKAGTYNETITLADGIDVQGGYSGTWTFDPASNETLLVGGYFAADARYITVRARDVTLVTRLSYMTLQGANAMDAGTSSYVVHAANTTNLIVDHVNIIAGNGANGADGANADNASSTPAPAGTPGQNADQYLTSCDDNSRGLGGSGGGTGTLAGGKGGDGGTMDTLCNGLSSNYNATGGASGANVTAAGVFTAGGDGGAPCQQGQPGNNGRTTHGTRGGANALTAAVVNDYWQPTGGVGGNGSVGSDGTGGAGGGGSGGCDSGTDAYGAGGGGGGAGGVRAPTAGQGGGYGGSSFGVFAVNSQVTIEASTVRLGNGGNGGQGGDGGAGQPGGTGGTGGVLAGGAGPGGRGGDGGDGGASGAGAGGAGGHSYGIYHTNSVINTTGVTFSGGSAGNGGNGGSATLPTLDGDPGIDGITANTANL